MSRGQKKTRPDVATLYCSHGKKSPNQKKGKKKYSSFFWDQEESSSAMVSVTVSTKGMIEMPD